MAGGVTALCFDSTGAFLASGGSDGCLFMHRMDGGGAGQPRLVEELGAGCVDVDTYDDVSGVGVGGDKSGGAWWRGALNTLLRRETMRDRECEAGEKHHCLIGHAKGQPCVYGYIKGRGGPQLVWDLGSGCVAA